LASEETIQAFPEMKKSIKKLRGLINYFKDVSVAREAFKKVMIDAQVEPLTIIQGTSNR
jgi:hypothetical protein